MTMNIGAILSRVRSLSDGGYTDEMLTQLVNEGLTVARRGLEAGTENEVYADDMLTFYVLAQLDLQNGDLEMYNNHSVMYNNALLEYRRVVAEDAVSTKPLTFKNIYV